jgi:hypothetical protein
VANEARDTLVIQTAKGTDLVRKIGKGQTVPLAFAAPGEYKWFVERRIGSGETLKKLVSEPYLFRIQPTPSSFAPLLSAGTSGVFYLEDF